MCVFVYVWCYNIKLFANNHHTHTHICESFCIRNFQFHLTQFCKKLCVYFLCILSSCRSSSKTCVVRTFISREWLLLFFAYIWRKKNLKDVQKSNTDQFLHTNFFLFKFLSLYLCQFMFLIFNVFIWMKYIIIYTCMLMY